MREKPSKLAERIAAKVIREVEDTSTSVSLFELIDRGVDGDLLVEVVRLLENAEFIVDTHFPKGLEQVVQDNIRECRAILRMRHDPKVERELEFLQAEPAVHLGCKFDKFSDTKHEADSGFPLMGRKCTATSSFLLKSTLDSPKKEMLILDGRVLVFDPEKFHHSNLN